MTQTLEPETTVDPIKIYKTSPELYDAMVALSNAAAKDIDAELGELAVTINAWNRINVTIRLQPSTR